MKKFLLIALMLAFVCTPALARGKRDVCDGPMAEIFNKCAVDNDTVSDDQMTEIGAGLDLILYEDIIKDIGYKLTGEYRYDWQNAEQSAYVVVTVKLKDIINKIKKEE